MSTAIAMAPSPAPHDRPAYASDIQQDEREPSSASRAALSLAALSNDTSANARLENGSPLKIASTTPSKLSPSSGPRNSTGPKIIVKKEPGSPAIANSTVANPKLRPKRLDLTKGDAADGGVPGTGRPPTARDGALGIQEVGWACLSPGFVTNDPLRNDMLRQSKSVMEQQRRMIEARLLQSAKGGGEGALETKDKDFTASTPGMLARRRTKAPPGLSIVAPSHERFANERVIQSAPLGQTFTGRNAQPLSRHIANHVSNLSSTSHIHHVPATQTSNRLPPLHDVFGQTLSNHHENRAPPSHPQTQYANPQPQYANSHANPSHHQQAQTPSRTMREYRSAEDAQIDLAGGRPDLLPKLVSYSGHPPHPPTPPHAHAPDGARSVSTGRRRSRREYEQDESPPLGHGPSAKRGPFGSGRDSPETQQAKKDEFISLCARAWDLFHS